MIRFAAGTAFKAALGFAGRWWLHGLSLGVPPRWRDALHRVPDRWLVALSGECLSVTWQPASGATHEITLPLDDRSEIPSRIRAALGAVDLDGARCIAVVPISRVLSRNLPLPRAAHDNLRSILAFEIERLTPFTSDAVCFSYGVTDLDSRRETMIVALRVALATDVRALLEQMAALGIRPHAVRFLDQDLRIAELPPGFAGKPPRSRRVRVRWRLALVAGALLLLNLYAPLAIQRIRTGRLEHALTELRTQAATRQQAIGAAARATEALRFLAAQRAAHPPIIALLADLSTQLPDDTFLARLTIADGKLQMQGQTIDAARLVPLIEESDRFEGTAHTAPINQNPATRTASFQIGATVSGVRQP